MSVDKAPEKALEKVYDLTMRMDLYGPKGRMWGFTQDYENLPPRYLFEITTLCGSYLEYLRGLATTGKAQHDATAPGQSLPAGLEYRIDFKYQSDILLPPPFDDLFSGEVGVPYLMYSVAVQAQKAGVALLNRLLESAEIEIKAGQRT